MNAKAEDGPLRIGSRFLGKYEIVGHLGSGGQAWVYRGLHSVTRREVAIKVVHSPFGVTREMRERGEKEARALGVLNHPNIVAMHDAGLTDDGIFYIVMELLRGRSLRATLVAHPRLEIEEVLRLAIQAGEALQVAHDHQIIHRDFKPDNTFLIQGNGLKVLDFGIAKRLDEIGFTTRKEVVLGSILYMSPEQAQGHALTPRSDICALGLIMYEALIGKHPTLLVFERELIKRHEPYRKPTIVDIPPLQVFELPPMLSELDPDIPLYVAQAVQRAIAKKAEQRFATMASFVEVLRECLKIYLRDTPAERRVPKRDLSLATAPASVAPRPSQDANVTEVIKPVATTSPDRGLAPTPSGDAITARTGRAPASSSPTVPSTARHDRQPPPGTPSSERQQPPARPASVPAPTAHAHTVPSRARLTPAKPATAPPVTVSPRQIDRRIGLASENAVEGRWSALIGGCLFGAVVGTLGVLAHFRLPLFAASGTHDERSVAHSPATQPPTLTSNTTTPAKLPPPSAPQQASEAAKDLPIPKSSSISPSLPKVRAAAVFNPPRAPKLSDSGADVPTLSTKPHESIY